MTDRLVALVGGLVLALSALGLAENEGRAGPVDAALQPEATAAEVRGTYEARPAGATVLGTCLQPPCDARTSVDLRFRGLPPAPYEARLVGGSPETPLGRLAAQGEALALRWSQASYTPGHDRLVLSLAGHDVAALTLADSPSQQRITARITVAWPEAAGHVRLAEVGGLAIATVAVVTVQAQAPEGWKYHAHLEGSTGPTELGALTQEGDVQRLEARVERLRLESQDRLVVVLRPLGDEGAGFPVLAAALGFP